MTIGAFSQTVQAERRTTPRTRVQLSAQLRTLENVVDITALDLSEGGMAVRAAHPMKPELQVVVQFALPFTEQSVICEGRIIWTDGKGLMGVQFNGLDDEQRLIIRDWLIHFCPGPEQA